jgi:carbon monoxide dehydrogenase subunit G
MKLTGTAILHAPASQAWAALTDPAVLARTIPGCERLEPAGPDSYRFTITAGVASIGGTYTGVVALTEQHQPTSLVLTARGAGAPGTVATSIRITLIPAGATTEVSYEADAAIGGLLAAVGQRLLGSVAGLLIGEFLTAVDQVLTGAGAVPASLAPAPLTAAGSASASPAPTTAAPTTTAPITTAPTTTGSPTTGPAFVRGALTGAAVTLAGVAIRGLIGRRSQ